MIDAYLDSCMVISLIEGAAAQQQLIRKNLMDRSVFSSDLVRLESKVTPIRNNNQNSLQQLESFFANCKMCELDRDVFDRTIQLRVESNLKAPDALHLAAALAVDCQEFWTDDKQLKAVAGRYLSVVDWAMLKERA